VLFAHATRFEKENDLILKKLWLFGGNVSSLEFVSKNIKTSNVSSLEFVSEYIKTSSISSLELFSKHRQTGSHEKYWKLLHAYVPGYSSLAMLLLGIPIYFAAYPTPTCPYKHQDVNGVRMLVYSLD